MKKLLNGVLSRLDLRLSRVSGAVHEGRREQRRLHAAPRGHPPVRWHLPSFAVTSDDIDIADRIMRVYRRARQDEADLASGETPGSDLWESIGEQAQRDFVARLRGDDPRQVAELLVNALHHRFTRGLCHDEGNDITYVRATATDGAAVATRIVDRFVAFAEALGVLQVEFPEWGRWGENLYADLAGLFEQVEKASGLDLTVPDAFGMYGVVAGERVIGVMMPDHAYSAWRIRTVLAEAPGARIAEIGGGFGGCAYFCAQWAASYAIVDLPVINAIQGFFLARTCGADAVQLYGEPPADRRLAALPYWEFGRIPEASLDVVLSQESLPEIGPAVAEKYVADVARISRYLLSINQETGAEIASGFRHNVVGHMVARHGGFVRRYRFPYWLRRGEIEELFEVMRRPGPT